MSKIRSMPVAALALGLTLGFAPVAQAGDAQKEIATAAAHAGMAAGAMDAKMVTAHMKHVVNCLVGPAASDYDSSQLNPCKDMGAGAIPDASPEKQMALEVALRTAKEGAMETDMVKAKEKAMATQSALGKLTM